MDARIQLVSADRAARQRHAGARRRAHDVLGGGRQSERGAGAVLHGGPGGGCSPEHRRFFDRRPSTRSSSISGAPALFSTPVGEVQSNTTQQLIADIGLLRDYLGARWPRILGGSRRITLGLAYGQVHSQRCSGFLLRGIFLGRQSEIDWFMYGLRQIFRKWEKFAGLLPELERGDLLRGYLKRLFDPDPRVHTAFARAWSEYEGSCSTLLPNPELVRHFAAEALGLARLEAHYFAHRCFLEPGRAAAEPRSDPRSSGLDRACALRHGVSDRQRRRLARAWPRARYYGHPGRRPFGVGTRRPRSGAGRARPVQVRCWLTPTMPRFAANISLMYPELPLPEHGSARQLATASRRWRSRFRTPSMPRSSVGRSTLHGAAGAAEHAGRRRRRWRRGCAALPGHEREFDASIARALEYARATGAPAAFTSWRACRADVPHADALAIYERNIAKACTGLAPHGIVATLEPINRMTSRATS